MSQRASYQVLWSRKPASVVKITDEPGKENHMVTVWRVPSGATNTSPHEDRWRP